MKSVNYAVAVLLLGVASQAQATQYAYCHMNTTIDGVDTYLHSGIVEIAEGDEARLAFQDGPFRRAFKEYVSSTYGYALGPTCYAASTLRKAKEGQEVYTGREVRNVRTGWLGGRPEAVDRGEPARNISDDALIWAFPGQKSKPNPQGTNSAPAKRQWEIDYEHKLAKYNEELARQQQAVAEYERAKAETEARRAEMAERARKARAEHERDVARCKAEGRCAVTKQ